MQVISGKRWSGRAALALAAAILVAGCTGAKMFVPVDYTEYSAELSGQMGWASGQSIILMDIINRAENTSLSTYSNTSGTIVYGDPRSGPFGIGGRPLESYFWYSIERALNSAGMTVYTGANPKPGAPRVQFILLSISDTEYKYLVQVYKGAAPLWSENYTLTKPALKAAEPDPEQLKQRAYRMTTEMVLVVFNDSEFRNAFSLAASR